MKLDADGWSKSWESIVAKSNVSWDLQRDNNNQGVQFNIHGGIGVSPSSVDVTSGWHQVAGVYDRNKAIIYVDGIATGSVNASPLDLETSIYNDQDWQIPKSAGKIRIGAVSNYSESGEPADQSFGGLIDQVRIFDAPIPKWAEHTGTPGIVEMYRDDGGHVSCDGYMEADVNEDCYITLADFALVAKDWLECDDEANADCD